MAIKRVDPGQAGAIGVGVRVPRSNAGDVLNAASDAVSRSAKGLDGIAGAVMNMGKAAEHAGDAAVRVKMQDAKLSQAKENEAHRVAISEQAFKQKQAEAYFKTDSALAVIEYGKILDGLMAAERPDYDNPNFMHIASKNADNALQKLINASYAIVGSEGSNGIGARNRELTEGAMREKLNLLKQRYLAEANARWNKHRAEVDIGKAGTVLNTMSGSGITDRTAYAKAVNESALPLYYTPQQLENLIDDAHKAGVGVAYGRQVEESMVAAQNTFNATFNNAIMSGHNFDSAKAIAFEAASVAYIDGIATGGVADVAGDKVAEAERNGLVALSSFADSVKMQSNSAQIAELQSVISGAPVSSISPLTLRQVAAYASETAYGNLEEMGKIAGVSDLMVLDLSEEDTKNLKIYLGNELAMCDLSTLEGRENAALCVQQARLLPNALYDQIRAQYRDMVLSIGKKDSSVSIAMVKEFLQEKNLDATDINLLSRPLLSMAKANPSQFYMIADDFVRRHELEKKSKNPDIDSLFWLYDTEAAERFVSGRTIYEHLASRRASQQQPAESNVIINTPPTTIQSKK